MKRDVCRIDFSRVGNEDLLRIKFYGLLDTYCVPFKSEGNLFRLMAKLKSFPPIKSLLREFCRVSCATSLNFRMDLQRNSATRIFLPFLEELIKILF